LVGVDVLAALHIHLVFEKPRVGSRNDPNEESVRSPRYFVLGPGFGLPRADRVIPGNLSGNEQTDQENSKSLHEGGSYHSWRGWQNCSFQNSPAAEDSRKVETVV